MYSNLHTNVYWVILVYFLCEMKQLSYQKGI